MLLFFKQNVFIQLKKVPFATCGRYLSLKVGDVATLSKRITTEDIKKFAELSGDTNPLHLDQEFINNHTTFENVVVHGAHLNSLVSNVIGTLLPGPGTVVVRQDLHFPSPCYAGETVEVTVKLASLRKISTVDFCCSATEGKVVLKGSAQLVLPQALKKES